MEQNLPKRQEIDEALTWRLEDIYPDAESWEKDRLLVLRKADEFASLEGGAVKTAAALLHALDLYEESLMLLYRIEGYARMRHDQDTADVSGQELTAKSQSAIVTVEEKLAWLEPEILTLSPEQIDAYFAEEPGLRKYEVMIREILRTKEHSLSAELEKLLASAGELAAVPVNAFGMLSNADLRFPTVSDAEGTVIRLSNGRFVPIQMSEDRGVRQEAFEKYYSRYADYKNTWAVLYDGQVKKQIFFAKARRYGSTFEAAVDGNNVDPSVCDNLFDSVHRNLDKMHRYVRLRKKLLGVDRLHMYDVYVPMVSDYNLEVSYEEAKAIAIEALKPLGEEYLSVVKEAFEQRWIDVVENEGKTSGAYSSNVYGVHPYMLLNYNNTLDNVFTLVHEMGHSLHTWYSCRNQNFFNAHYKIFVAEVASTTNEILLLEYLLGKARDVKEKAFLINHYLESFKGTLFRQTMFEEFERKTNRMAEEGIPLTADTLCKTYYELNQQYFGEDMVSDPLIAYEWCRIPHFYYNFYVYQYATSFAASVAIAHRILDGGQAEVDQYIRFLSSGCTQDPVSLLKLAGVDLSTAEPIDAALEVFGNAITQMEELMA